MMKSKDSPLRKFCEQDLVFIYLMTSRSYMEAPNYFPISVPLIAFVSLRPLSVSVFKINGIRQTLEKSISQTAFQSKFWRRICSFKNRTYCRSTTTCFSTERSKLGRSDKGRSPSITIWAKNLCQATKRPRVRKVTQQQYFRNS
eukprot:GHVP01010280.1.p1 GENE.GHVP01010280.1~~GHVP01010280.1.p1  ORF type:complete len:144 (+),score=7.80 GHVP01010280.1:538-969(+)